MPSHNHFVAKLLPPRRLLFAWLDRLLRIGRLTVGLGFVALLGLLLVTGWQQYTTREKKEAQTSVSGLRYRLESAGAALPMPRQIDDPALVALGEMLFFNTALSGNRDRSCASCHMPARFSADGQPLPRTTDSNLLPRHVPDLYLRGAAGWHSMHWDGSMEKLPDGQWRMAEGIQLPAHLDEPLTAAVAHALVSPTRMRGSVQSAAEGNDLALIPNGDAWAVGRALARRLAEEPSTASAMRAVYPGLEPAEAGLPHIANALAAWIRVAWGTLDSPWDRFLAGNHDALSAEAVRGATLFYGEAGCGTCHSGALLTDQQFHNIGVPQIGPGFDEQGLDFGRYLVTGDPRHYFAFRTPPLRNVALTGPYMHNGVYNSLAEAVRHHHNAAELLKSFDAGRLPSELHVGKQREAYTTWLLTRSLSPYLRELPPLSEAELQDILAFLNALTSPSLLETALGDRE